jgi:hypothetical protein
LAGAAAVLVPIVLHMARRQTRRQVPFSTLMFLESSPPRFERRQRIEHWALLALRCLVFLLLAAAFARPFVARPVPALVVGAGERLVVLVDTSASMRRAGLWEAAQARVRARLGRAGSADRVAVMAFDRRTRTVVGFDEWARQRSDARVSAALQQLAAQPPGWESTDLGRALMTAAEAIVDDEGDSASVRARVALVSDLQEGSRLDALGISDWPARIALELDALEAEGANASLQALPELVGDEPRGLRVRVSTSGRAAHELSLQIRWSDGGAPVAVALPAGQSRVVEAPARAGDKPGALVVEGDAADFDNQLYVAPPVPVHVNILYVGADDGNDPQQPLFYLRRAFPTTRLRAPEITARRPDAADLGEGKAAQLAVVTAAPGSAALAALRAQLEHGRSVLVVMDAPAAAATVSALAGVSASAVEGTGDALLTEVNLTHPVLAPFADPRFGDFTKIRFWKHRRLDEKRLPGARVLARFDDGAPAWLVLSVGRGALFVMTAGWHPADSQLALSTKFVPLLHGLLEASAGLDSGQAQFFVGDPVTLPVKEGGGERRVRRPDGRVVTLEAGSSVFTETDLPGLYGYEDGGTTRTFAVNLDPAESIVAPMPPESLERLGLTAPAPMAVTAAPSRESGFYAGLERDQRLWQWLLVAALAVLVLETALAARASRRTA